MPLYENTKKGSKWLYAFFPIIAHPLIYPVYAFEILCVCISALLIINTMNGKMHRLLCDCLDGTMIKLTSLVRAGL